MAGKEWELEKAASLPQLVRLLEWEQGSVPKRKPQESEACYENRLRKMLATIRRSVDAIG